MLSLRVAFRSIILCSRLSFCLAHQNRSEQEFNHGLSDCSFGHPPMIGLSMRFLYQENTVKSFSDSRAHEHIQTRDRIFHTL